MLDWPSTYAHTIAPIKWPHNLFKLIKYEVLIAEIFVIHTIISNKKPKNF